MTIMEKLHHIWVILFVGLLLLLAKLSLILINLLMIQLPLTLFLNYRMSTWLALLILLVHACS